MIVFKPQEREMTTHGAKAKEDEAQMEGSWMDWLGQTGPRPYPAGRKGELGRVLLVMTEV